MKQPLTKPQGDLYNWIRNYIQEHGYAPSIREMVKSMDLRSTAPIQSRLKHLRQKGWITWNDGKARTICIVEGDQGDRPVTEYQSLKSQVAELKSRLALVERERSHD
jgi:repressor LexA